MGVFNLIRRSVGVACVLGLVAVVTQSASAAPLGLTRGLPDIYSNAITVSYNAGTDLFVATGFPSTYDLDGVAPADYNINNGSRRFSLNVTVDGAGNAIGGTLEIKGRVYNPASPSIDVVPFGTLLHGTLALGQFGFSASGGDIFEFIFNVDSGALAPAFGPTVGVILTAPGIGFTGSFSTSFSTTGGGYADTFAVPVPAALPAGLGLLALLAGRRLTKKWREKF